MRKQEVDFLANENEDYLDRLLNSVVGQEIPHEQKKDEIVPDDNPETEENISAEMDDEIKPRRSRRDKKKRRWGRKVKEETFLDEFEKELEELDSEKFISDYELQLDEELVENKNEIEELQRSDSEKIQSNYENDFFAGLDEVMSQAGTEDSIVQAGVMADDSVEEETIENQPETELLKEDDEATVGDESINSAENFSEEGSADESESADDVGTDDILSMLNSLGEEDADLADIGDMLKADENHEPVTEDEDLSDGLADLGFDIDPEDLEDLSSIKEVGPDKKDAKEDEKKPKEKKNGFLSKLKNLFFGPDEDAVSQDNSSEGIAETSDLDGVSDENLDILKALEGGAKEDTSEEKELSPKEKKKAAKEEKKKAAKAKKEAKAKEKEAKKKLKAEKKAAKPKKEKKPKVKDNTPPLPKVPVILTFLMVASFVGATLFIGHGVHYRQAYSVAQENFNQGNFVNAYNEISGIKVKKNDEQFYEKVKTLASMQGLLESYETLKDAKREELALDSLVRVIGHYNANIDHAGEAGYSAEISQLEEEAEKLLKAEYHVSYDKAVKLYGLRSRNKYSIEIYKILVKEGLV